MTGTNPEEDLLGRLRVAMATAADSYHAGTGEDDDRGHEREGAALALAAVTDYLTNIGFDRRLIAPLRATLAAIADIDEGTNNELFILRTSEGGAPPLGHRRAADLGMASAIMTLLMMRGGTEHEAAVRVARVLNACGVNVAKRPGVREEAALINWRKKLKSGKKDRAAQNIYAGFCSPPQYENFSAEDLLRTLRKALSPESS